MLLRTMLLLLITPIIYAAPVVKETFQNYLIAGRTVDMLRQQMTILGPSDIEGEHFHASTHWYVRWQYNYQKSSNACYLTNVNVNVDITYQFPAWIDYAVADYALKSRWNEYLLNLQTHERGHAENGIKAAIAIEQALKELPAMASCSDLMETADAVAYQKISVHNSIDMSYENETNHGATQGATF